MPKKKKWARKAAEESLKKDLGVVTEKDLIEAAQKVSVARTNLIASQPFYGFLATHLRMAYHPKFTTMATDGRHLFFHPNFVNSITKFELVGVVAHEIGHCTMRHFARIQDRDPETWNKAGDYKINQEVTEAGFVLPSDALRSDEYKDDNAEIIYKKLQEKQDKQPGCQWGVVLPAPDQSDPSDVPSEQVTFDGDGNIMSEQDLKDAAGNMFPKTAEELAEEWDENIINAKTEAGKRQGFVPGSAQERIDRLAKPKVNWRARLAAFMSVPSKDDYSWRRPSRRFLHEDLLFPSLYSETIGTVVIARDTSGSMNSANLTRCLTETQSLLKFIRPNKIIDIQFDADVQRVTTLTPNDLPLPERMREVVGRGGTVVRPVFDYIAENYINPHCVIFMTDMGFGWDASTRFSFPLIWLDTDNGSYCPEGLPGTKIIVDG